MLVFATLFALTAVATLAAWWRTRWLAERRDPGAWRYVRWLTLAGGCLAVFAMGLYVRQCGAAFVAMMHVEDPAQHAGFLAAGLADAGTLTLPVLAPAWALLALAVALARQGQHRLGLRDEAVSEF
ncbi:MAG: hypothetical protein AAGH15_18955 [Myxococcota bacterium]